MGGGGGALISGGAFIMNFTVYIFLKLHCGAGRKEMFYLTTHSTHFIYGLYMASVWSWKEVFQANDLTHTVELEGRKCFI